MFEEPEAVASRVLEAARGKKPALFLDFDGTLAPIVERPEAAQMPAQTQATLSRLTAYWPVTILSGRGLIDLASRVELERGILAGSHGWEIDGAGIPAPPVPIDAADRLAKAATGVARALGDIEGVEIEDKRLAVAVHWRRADPDALPAIEAAVARVAEEVGELRMTAGKKVLELRPAFDWHKGHALRHVRAALPQPSFAIFAGDDVTDLDALAAVCENGFGITVGEALPHDAGTARLADPDAVSAFLLEVLTRLGGAA